MKLPYVKRIHLEDAQTLATKTLKELASTQGALTAVRSALEQSQAHARELRQKTETLEERNVELQRQLETARATIRGYDHTMQGIIKLCSLNMPRKQETA